MLPLENSSNTRVLVRLNTILTVIISITCLLNVLASTLIFAESKETFYQPQPNPIEVSGFIILLWILQLSIILV